MVGKDNDGESKGCIQKTENDPIVLCVREYCVSDKKTNERNSQYLFWVSVGKPVFCPLHTISIVQFV